MEQVESARDGELLALRSNDQDWSAAWHPPTRAPDGTPHGVAGVCRTDDDKIVFISHDGEHWGFPAGRPEPGESVEETLRREVLEEACARVVAARLLGYTRGECVRGPQQGLVLVRSYWRAEVEVQPWLPRFEIPHRRVVEAREAFDHLSEFDLAATRLSCRALHEAGVR